jgi:hypothetical protein
MLDKQHSTPNLVAEIQQILESYRKTLAKPLQTA